jgi:hypothetical protein
MYTEFLAATLEAHGQIEEARIADAFDQIDRDDSCFISRENLIKILGQIVSDEYVESLIKEVDIDSDLPVAGATSSDNSNKKKKQMLPVAGATSSDNEEDPSDGDNVSGDGP